MLCCYFVFWFGLFCLWCVGCDAVLCMSYGRWCGFVCSLCGVGHGQVRESEEHAAGAGYW